MSWMTLDGTHEVSVTAEWADGAVAIGSTSGPDGYRAMVRPADAHNLDADPELRDGRDAIGWRARCECGWRGVLHRITEAADPGGWAPPDLEEALESEWRSHLLPAAPINDATRGLPAWADIARACRADLDASRADLSNAESWLRLGWRPGEGPSNGAERVAALELIGQAAALIDQAKGALARAD